MIHPLSVNSRKTGHNFKIFHLAAVKSMQVIKWGNNFNCYYQGSIKLWNLFSLLHFLVWLYFLLYIFAIKSYSSIYYTAAFIYLIIALKTSSFGHWSFKCRYGRILFFNNLWARIRVFSLWRNLFYLFSLWKTGM